jgi:hypothetical protein
MSACRRAVPHRRTGGTVLPDAGRLVGDAATGELIKVSGHHPLVLGDPSALATLCAALD